MMLFVECKGTPYEVRRRDVIAVLSIVLPRDADFNNRLVFNMVKLPKSRLTVALLSIPSCF